jgi:hypothetical protein
VNWIKKNSDIDITKPFPICGLNNEIFIDDIERNERYSLYDLSSKLSDLENSKPGDYERSFNFSNAFLISKDIKVKISSYKVAYSIQEPIKTEIEIDYSEELFGIIEYLQKRVKRRIFKNGNVK